MINLQRLFWSLYGRLVWDAYQYSWKDEQVRRIVDLVRECCGGTGKRVLDAGCGTGDYALALAEAGFDVTGIDFAPGMLSRAKAKLGPGMAVQFREMNLDGRLSFADAAFDEAINISVLQNVRDPVFTLGEIRRVLKLGGTLILLHVPRSEAHDLPLREVLRFRMDRLRKKDLWSRALVICKTWAERSRISRYWTQAEVEALLRASGYVIRQSDPGPPIVVIAET